MELHGNYMNTYLYGLSELAVNRVYYWVYLDLLTQVNHEYQQSYVFFGELSNTNKYINHWTSKPFKLSAKRPKDDIFLYLIHSQ